MSSIEKWKNFNSIQTLFFKPGSHALVVRIEDFLVTHVNEYVNKLNTGQISDCFCNGIEFTQSHRPEEVIPDPCDKCEPGLKGAYNFCTVL